MFGTNKYIIWINLYGIEKANEMQELWKKNVGESIKGILRSKEAKEKYKKAALNRKKYECDHCKKSFDAGNFNNIERLLRQFVLKKSFSQI